MPATKSIQTTVDKWRSRSAVATQDYAAGVTRSGVDWQGPTLAAADAYAVGVQEAIGQGRFARGVQAAGNSRWQNRAREVGSQRFGPGVAASVDRYQQGFAPFLNTIAGITLPPRGPRGSAGNLQRVQLIADALHQQRIGQT